MHLFQEKVQIRQRLILQMLNQRATSGFQHLLSPSSWHRIVHMYALDKLKHAGRALMAIAALASLVMVAACQESATFAPVTSGKVVRSHAPSQVARGQALFTQHCAVCHGERAQGDANWRQRNPDGRFPPPPLNGTGHAWHHPHEWLKAMIRNGSAPQGNMPAWSHTLDDQQIEDIIAWFQSLWPDEVYAAWYEMEQRRQGLARQ